MTCKKSLYRKSFSYELWHLRGWVEEWDATGITSLGVSVVTVSDNQTKTMASACIGKSHRLTGWAYRELEGPKLQMAFQSSDPQSVNRVQSEKVVPSLLHPRAKYFESIWPADVRWACLDRFEFGARFWPLNCGIWDFGGHQYNVHGCCHSRSARNGRRGAWSKWKCGSVSLPLACTGEDRFAYLNSEEFIR